MSQPLPAWIRPADRALAFAARRIGLIRAVSPTNAEEETARLAQALTTGAACVPCFRYEACPIGAPLCVALDRLAGFVENEGPVGGVYAARARELALEAEMVDAVGTPRITSLAAARFGSERADAEQALALAEAWLAQDAPRDGAPRTRTCDPADPGSLLFRMSSEVGRRKIPVRVRVEPGLASLAATGDGVVLVAQGKLASRADVERTVLHEIEGHVLPRVRAAAQPLSILAVGTARGLDDQEGRALLLERQAGLFGLERRRELALRHLAACATLEGAHFVDVVRLLRSRGADMPTAVRIAARVQRGGAGTGGGIAREVVYLPALVRVERAFERWGAAIERVMQQGRVAVAEAPIVDRLVLGGNLHDPAAP
jgi:hypothetical protein